LAPSVRKSHLLKTSPRIKKILRLDDTDNKKSLAQILLTFSKKRNRSGDALKDFTTDEINKKIQRENVIHLAILLLHRFRRSNIV
jgi:hypothetical protein